MGSFSKLFYHTFLFVCNKIFWRRCFASPRLLRPGQVPLPQLRHCVPVFFLDVGEDEHVLSVQLTSVAGEISGARLHVTLVADVCKHPALGPHELQT